MKKLFICFVALVATASLWADDFQIGYISCEITGENTVELDYADEEITQAVIPNTVSYRGKTYRVTSIGSDAFYDCAKLTSVTIGDYVKNIRQDAFAECNSLQRLSLPASLTHIGNSAFGMCERLYSIIYKGT